MTQVGPDYIQAIRVLATLVPDLGVNVDNPMATAKAIELHVLGERKKLANLSSQLDNIKTCMDFDALAALFVRIIKGEDCWQELCDFLLKVRRAIDPKHLFIEDAINVTWSEQKHEEGRSDIRFECLTKREFRPTEFDVITSISFPGGNREIRQFHDIKNNVLVLKSLLGGGTHIYWSFNGRRVS